MPTTIEKNQIIKTVKRNRNYAFGSILASFVFLCSCSNSYSDAKAIIPVTEVIMRANSELQKLNFTVSENSIVLVSLHDVPWNDFFPPGKELNKLKLLERQKFWAIYYYNPKYTSDDICIFINAITGKVITNYRGKSIFANELNITAVEAINIARNEIARAKADVDRYLISISLNKFPWNLSSFRIRPIKRSPTEMKKNYWVVYCFDKYALKDGDMYIFINAQNGNIEKIGGSLYLKPARE